MEGLVNALIHSSYTQVGSEDFLLTLFNMNYNETLEDGGQGGGHWGLK